jgi:hypothetical protein
MDMSVVYVFPAAAGTSRALVYDKNLLQFLLTELPFP